MSTASPKRLRIDAGAVARAEAALAAMAVNFDEWLKIEITRITRAPYTRPAQDVSRCGCTTAARRSR